MDSMKEKMKKRLDDELMALARKAISDRKAQTPQKNAEEQAIMNVSIEDLEKAVVSVLIGLLSSLLKLSEDKIDVDENVANYGMDSLVITEFIKRVSDKYEIQLQATIFFEARNLNRLASIICSRYKEQVEAVHQITPTEEPKKEERIEVVQESDVEEEELLKKYRTIFSRNQPAKKVQTETKNDSTEYEPIAIIGVDGMFAKSDSPEALWENLRNEVDCIEEIPSDRWDWKAVQGNPQKENKTNVKWGGFIPKIDQFDPGFFNISPKEAELMDPQHRLFIQSVWKSIYSSGYSAGSLSGKKVGLFLGINLQDYQMKLHKQDLDPMTLTAAHHVFCPSRIAFLLNISGPCQVVDTACSSSLVAIHRAVLAIQNEGCEMAIAGGANVMMDPMMHVQYAKTGMICEDGRCKTFSNAANGYVRGDGVGSVILKKLSAAERDNDPILGVIKGSAENHGGTSASLTAPNPVAQAALIKEAIQKAGVDPRAVGYIESHGTGTALGDPIEINGIKSAFNDLFNEGNIENPPTNYCNIGSVKSNIGHAETAAGMAGLIKVLFGMKHQFIPKSLHTEVINPLIDLNGTPFTIAQDGKEWKPTQIENVEFPRTAGISSFGAGGANAHIIVEEYNRAVDPTNYTGTMIVPFSGKSEKSLTKNVRAIRDFIAVSNSSDSSLNNLIQQDLVGWFSQHLNLDASEIDLESSFVELNIERYDLMALSVVLSEKWLLNDIEPLVVSGDSINDLIDVLAKELSGELSKHYDISVNRAEVRSDIDLGHLTHTLQEGRDEFNHRAAFVVQSVLELKQQLDLYLDQKNSDQRFEGNTRKEKLDFLLEGKAGQLYIQAAVEHKELKALAQLWVKGISIDWNLLKVSGARKIQLPPYQFAQKRYWIEEVEDSRSIMQTEMLTPLLHQNTSDFIAQKFQSTFTGKENFLSDHKVQEIETLPGVAYIELARSGGELALNEPITSVQDIVWLTPIQIKDETVDVSTHLMLDQDEVKYEIRSKGGEKERIHSQGKLLTSTLSNVSNINLDSLKSRFGKRVESAVAYQEFKSRGLNYGLTFQGIQELHVSTNEALSQISLNPNSAYILPPGVLDSALQTCMGINFELNSQSLELPFSIKSLDIHGPLTGQVWCHARLSKNEGGLKEYDLDLFDSAGKVLVQIKGFVAVSIHGEKVKKESKTHYYESVWQPKTVQETSERVNATDHVVLFGLPKDLATELEAKADWQVESVQKSEPIVFFEYIKSKVVEAIQSKTRLNLTIVGESEGYTDYAFIRGLIKSAAQEYPQFSGRVIGIESSTVNASSLTDLLNRELHSENKEINYKNGERLVRALKIVQLAGEKGIEIRSKGSYLITGGVGGLGLLFANHLSKKTSGTVVLSGRSALNAVKQTLVDSIPNAIYVQCDVTDQSSVNELIKTIQSEYGELKGILHGAGVLRDSVLIQKTKEEAKAVFGPKVTGLQNLDKATEGIELDFLFCFSSVSAILGNVGQSDYSSANAFMDDFIIRRNQLVKEGKRFGATLAVNWPLWRSGGMQIDESSEQYLKRHWGMEPLSSDDGLTAFDTVLTSDLSSFGVVFGELNELNKKFFNRSLSKKKKAVTQVIEKSEELESRVEMEILTIAANVLKLDIEEMESDVELGDFGFDSISLTQFSNALNEKYDLNLVPTIFYNYPTIAELVTFLLDEHIDKLGSFNEEEIVEEDEVTEIAVRPQISSTSFNRFVSLETASKADEIIEHKAAEVAIVGIAGRMPGADTLDQYWENLVNKRDSIREVPSDRWDWKEYYGDPYREKNKTKAKHGGFINDIDKFDALFFNISPHEAELMDPQQRITLEQVYHLFENAGINPNEVKGSDTGVFVGVSSTDYSILLKKHADVVDEAHFSTGYSHAVLANRISYLFDLHGPSEPIDTACSSSLVAIHRAVENIKSGNCTMAIAGGVNALLAPDLTLSFSQAGMLSEDGRCKTFDERANGYVRGEGVGLVLLKSLEEAEKDGDHIYGVIKGSNENHGGKANTLTSPNPKAQKALLVKAYTKAGVNPVDVSYIEAHGTGTPLGDPIETEALKLAFKEIASQQSIELPKAPFCKLGSVKTNIGHLESAAGIAGVLKVLLGLKNNQLPGNPHLQTPNEYLELNESPFQLLKDTESWAENNGKPRTAGVSSFGFGGANAHVIIQEYVNRGDEQASTDEVLICLSAKTKKQLEDQKSNYLNYLQMTGDVNLGALAYTLQIGREEMTYRWATQVRSVNELIDNLTSEGNSSNVFEGRVQKSVKVDQTELSELIQRKDLKELAAHWISGASINWKDLYKGENYAKLQLPTYPFARNRYWIPGFEQVSESPLVIQELDTVSEEKLHPLLHQIK